MHQCLLGLGSNLGDRRQILATAIRRLGAHPAIDLKSVSPWLETSPVGGPPGQEAFLNGAARLATSLAPQELLAVTQDVERQLGRQRGRHWDARPLDIDILLYGELVLASGELTIPHPWMAVRRFVLQPAEAIAGDMLHPELGWSVERLFQHLRLPAQRFVVDRSSGTSRNARICQRLGAEHVSDPLAETPRSAPETAARSGPDPDRAIESFELRRQRLIESSWMQPTSRVICDFWLQQWPVIAAGDHRPAMQWSEHVRKRSAEIPPPKLIVVAREPQARGDESTRIGGIMLEHLRDAGDCPWLQVAADSPEKIDEAVSAAFISMQ